MAHYYITHTHTHIHTYTAHALQLDTVSQFTFYTHTGVHTHTHSFIFVYVFAHTLTNTFCVCDTFHTFVNCRDPHIADFRLHMHITLCGTLGQSGTDMHTLTQELHIHTRT